MDLLIALRPPGILLVIRFDRLIAPKDSFRTDHRFLFLVFVYASACSARGTTDLSFHFSCLNTVLS